MFRCLYNVIFSIFCFLFYIFLLINVDCWLLIVDCCLDATANALMPWSLYLLIIQSSNAKIFRGSLPQILNPWSVCAPMCVSTWVCFTLDDSSHTTGNGRFHDEDGWWKDDGWWFIVCRCSMRKKLHIIIVKVVTSIYGIKGRKLTQGKTWMRMRRRRPPGWKW